MEERPVVYSTLETDLIDGGSVGGLGHLTCDTFYEARRRGYPFYLFSLCYPIKLCQEADGDSVRTVRIPTNNSMNKVDSFIVNTKWYQFIASIYLHSLSTEKTRAYFVKLSPTNGNEWLNELELYNEKDEGQQVFVRYAFAKSVSKFLKAEEIVPKLYHLNESDTAFMILTADEEGLNSRIVGHTHTPLPGGHKKYRKGICECLIEDKSLEKLKVGEDGEFINFGKILAHYSEILCCVSKKHEIVTKECLYPGFKEKITHVTNGISLEWVNPHLVKLFDEYIPRWKDEPELLDNIDAIPNKPVNKLLESHDLSKNDLSKGFKEWKRSSEVISNFDEINPNNHLVTYAKRLIEYKRADRLLGCVDLFDNDEVTFIFAGRPIGDWGDNFLKDLIHTIKNFKASVAYVLNYNREKARALVQGSDVWINIPVSDYEACGTSFEKAILNGNILVSTPAGGVPEIIVDGKNGLIVEDDLSNLDKKLKEAVDILKDKEKHARQMKDTISSSYFVTTHRMFDDYISKLYN